MALRLLMPAKGPCRGDIASGDRIRSGWRDVPGAQELGIVHFIEGLTGADIQKVDRAAKDRSLPSLKPLTSQDAPLVN
jgi:hypothetical protein